MSATVAQEINHAEQNAAAHAERIEAMADAVAFCRERQGAPKEARELSREARALMHEHLWDGTNGEETAEAIEEAAQEEALSIEFRASNWVSSASEIEPDEYRVLLTTGGPALQITGRFDPHRGATSVRMEHQDWGTPWTEYHGADKDALFWFVGLLCLGDC